jgi:hypothetical protein
MSSLYFDGIKLSPAAKAFIPVVTTSYHCICKPQPAKHIAVTARLNEPTYLLSTDIIMLLQKS